MYITQQGRPERFPRKGEGVLVAGLVHHLVNMPAYGWWGVVELVLRLHCS